jgi:hypothetical protein
MPGSAEHPSRSAARMVILGAGPFGAGIATALAHDSRVPVTVHVAARDRNAAGRACTVAGAQAAAVGSSSVFLPHRVDAADGAGLRALLERVRPGVVVVAVSHQAPAESSGPRTAWTDLLDRAGFGVTLPLQADLALRVAAACAETGPTALINACFPDAVNGLIQAAGLPVLCGVGNIGTLAAAVAATLAPPDRPRLRMVAHHGHLHVPAEPAAEAQAWLDDVPLADLAGRLAPVRALSPAARNAVGAGSAAPVVRAAAGAGPPWTGHVPGPLGLPGGYPVRLDGPRLTVLPPAPLGLDRAVACNQRAAALDGIRVADGGARFTDSAYRALSACWPRAPREFAARQVGEVCDDLLDLRDQLRKTTPAH